MKTFVMKKSEQKFEWFVVDAKGKVLGRLASQIANLLRGKNKPYFINNMDPQVGVIVINCEKIKVTGNKLADKRYYWHTGHPGGMKYRTLGQYMETKPELPIMHAVKGMLPKNKMRNLLLTRLRVYPGENNPHMAQNPKIVEIQ